MQTKQHDIPHRQGKQLFSYVLTKLIKLMDYGVKVFPARQFFVNVRKKLVQNAYFCSKKTQFRADYLV